MAKLAAVQQSAALRRTPHLMTTGRWCWGHSAGAGHRRGAESRQIGSAGLWAA